MQPAEAFDVGVSLGDNCEPVAQFDRLGMSPKRNLPFDWSTIEWKVLLDVIRTDFEGVFTKNVTVRCDETLFSYNHRPVEEVASTIAHFHSRVERFRALRSSDQRILFVRTIDPFSASQLAGRHERLAAALREYGFSRFHLLFGVRLWMKPELELPVDSRWIALRRMGPDGEMPWTGIAEDWDEGLAAVMPLFRLDEAEAMGG